MIYTVFSDATPEHERCSVLSLSTIVANSCRTKNFFFLHTATHVARLVGPPLGSALMDQHLWAPFVLAVIAMITQLAILAFLPETAPRVTSDYSSLPLDDPQHDEDVMEEQRATPTEVKSWTSRFQETWSTLINPRVKTFLRHSGLRIILACFLGKRIGFASENLAFQYASEQFAMKFSQTVWLRVANAIGAVVVLAAILPFLHGLVTGWTTVNDVKVVQGSLVNAVLGFCLMWQSWSFVVLAIGMDYGSPTRL